MRYDKKEMPFFFTFKGLSNSPIFLYLNFSFHRHFKQITTVGATTAAVTKKVWGEYVSVVC